MARRNIDRIEPGEDIITDGLMDEAFFTSFVEGAPVSRLECRRFLKSGEDPSNVGEVLAQNNLSAIKYMADHRYEPFSARRLLSLAQLLTNTMDAEAEDYRVSDGHRIPGRGSACSEVPPASDIPRMMDSLFGFLNEYEMHPLLKAAIAHAYILLVRPFDDGNERLARLLSYDILLRNGYSFFRQFALSGMIAQDGILYYKAMEALQDARSGGDMLDDKHAIRAFDVVALQVRDAVIHGNSPGFQRLELNQYCLTIFLVGFQCVLYCLLPLCFSGPSRVKQRLEDSHPAEDGAGQRYADGYNCFYLGFHAPSPLAAGVFPLCIVNSLPDKACRLIQKLRGYRQFLLVV